MIDIDEAGRVIVNADAIVLVRLVEAENLPLNHVCHEFVLSNGTVLHSIDPDVRDIDMEIAMETAPLVKAEPGNWALTYQDDSYFREPIIAWRCLRWRVEPVILSAPNKGDAVELPDGRVIDWKGDEFWESIGEWRKAMKLRA